MVRRTVIANPLSLVALALLACAAALVLPAQAGLFGNALRTGLADHPAAPAVCRAALKSNPGVWMPSHNAVASVSEGEYGALLAVPGLAPATAENRDWPTPSLAAFSGRAPPGSAVLTDIC
jgi:hypothetical protein